MTVTVLGKEGAPKQSPSQRAEKVGLQMKKRGFLGEEIKAYGEGTWPAMYKGKAWDENAVTEMSKDSLLECMPTDEEVRRSWTGWTPWRRSRRQPWRSRRRRARRSGRRTSRRLRRL